MSIVNRRNAILGWSVWTVGKSAAKRKAKQAVKVDDRRSGKLAGKGAAVASGLAAAGGALWFWRRRRDGDET